MSHYDASPVNPLPTSVIVLALALVVPEIIFQVGENGLFGGPGAIGWRAAAVERFAFFPEYLDWAVDTGRWPVEILVRLVAYPFVHISFLSTVFALVFVLALGKMVGEAISGATVLVVFLGSSVLAALLYWVLLNDPYPLLGGFPGAYGLIGAYTFLYWLRQVATGGPQSQAFQLIAFLMGIQLLFGLIFDTGNDWVADLAGFVSGFVLSFLMVPGGVARLIAWIRQR